MPRPAAISPSPLWLVPIAVVSATVAGSLLGRGPFFLTLAGFALLGAIWIFWRSLQSLTGEAPLTLDEALGLGAPNAEEERKTAVLRALKDLEYERTVGKIEEQDFLELSEKYRAEARGLLQLVDENLGSTRREVLAVVQRRVESELGVAPTSTVAESTDRDDSSGGEPAADKTKVETAVDAAQQERADG
jgi:hypothetical protein